MTRRSRNGRPLIAVTVPVRSRASAPTVGALAESGYIKGAEIAGGLPVLLSPAHEESTSGRLLAMSSGVILTGGEDVDPRRYGGREAAADHVSPERDELEFQVAEAALERGLPILAICRGMQLLNVVLGGTLYEDLLEQGVTEFDHNRSGKAVSREIHGIRVNGLDRLTGVFRSETFQTNSTHHQAVRELGESVVAVAHADDGVVEAMEVHERSGWIAGVQWHPERRLTERTGTNRRLFERFGQAVREASEQGR